MDKNIKAVILDWGGVVIEDPVPGLMRCCAEALGVSVADYRAVHQRFGEGFQTGRLRESEFWQVVCVELAVPEPQQESLWGWAFRQIYQPRQRVLNRMSQLQAEGLATALLSNTEMAAVDFYADLGYAMFDVAVFSCVEAVAKPEAGIYHRACERLDVPASQCLFLDDRSDFVVGAQAVGMKAIRCQTEAQVIAALT